MLFDDVGDVRNRATIMNFPLQLFEEELSVKRVINQGRIWCCIAQPRGIYLIEHVCYFFYGRHAPTLEQLGTGSKENHIGLTLY